jgi:protein subunit release factor A
MDFTFTNPSGTVTMTDVIVTLTMIGNGIVIARQKAKDEQLANRDVEIKYLRERIAYLEDQAREKSPGGS